MLKPEYLFACAMSLISTALGLPDMAQAAGPHAYPVVPQCSHVFLTAAYLAEEKPGNGPGFYLQIENRRDQAVAILDPVPLSVHWYARSGNRWLWRASSGEGGSLVDAFRENGPVFAQQGRSGSTAAVRHLIAAHSTYTWSAFMSDSPVLRYRPGCQHCTYSGEQQFRAVLAYAYLPSATDGRSDVPFLRCGLRSKPVVMPPLQDSSTLHNSSSR